MHSIEYVHKSHYALLFTIVCTTKALLFTGKPSAIETLHHVLKQNCGSSHTAFMRNITNLVCKCAKTYPWMETACLQVYMYVINL